MSRILYCASKAWNCCIIEFKIMQTHQQMLESLGKDIFDEIESMIVGLSAMDEEYRQRFTESQAKEQSLEKQIRVNEEKQAQVNNEWLSVLKVREENIKKINQHLFNQGKVCQRLENAYISAPPQNTAHQDLAAESLAAISESIFAQQCSLFLARN